MFRCACLIGLVAVTIVSCSSSNSAAPNAASGTGGSGGEVAGGSSGSTTQIDAGGLDANSSSGTALCPTTGDIMPGTAASPLPDGVEVVGQVSPVRGMVAVNDTAAFWADDRSIHRMDLRDGTDTVILDRSAAGNSMQGLAVDGDTVYFAEAGIRMALGVAKVAASGGPPTTIVSGNSMGKVTVSGGFVYHYDAARGEIGRASVGGGMQAILVRNVNPGPMLVANGHLYFVHPRSNFSTANVLRVPITAQAPPSTSPDVVLMPAGAEVVAPGDHYAADSVAANDKTLYFDDNNRVMMVPLAGGAATKIYQAPDGRGLANAPTTTRIGPVLAAQGKVYWEMGAGRCPDIMWSNSDGSAVGTRIHRVVGPSALVTNRTHVYFVAGGKQLLRAKL